MSQSTFATENVTASPDNATQDNDLERRVSIYLAERLRPSLRDLDVEVADGVVTLHGRLHTFYEKQLAISCCQRVAGVLKLIDDVEVSAV